jgi:anaerobic selenocysteine-containing dehydrogenase
LKISRRQFVSWGLAAGATLGLEGLGQAFYGHVMRTTNKLDEPVPSACRACLAGCGIVGYVRNQTRLTAIMGNPEHPASQGKICALALAAMNLHYHPERLWQAQRRNDRRPAAPDGSAPGTPALLDSAARVLADLADGGATVVVDTWDEQAWHADLLHALGGRGKLIGREWLSGWNRREIMTKVWGAEVRPDLEKIDLLLVFGDRPLDEGPRFIQDARRIVEAQVDHGMKMIVFDPRLSNTGGKADLWMPIRPGTERIAALALVRRALEHANLNAHVNMRGKRQPLYYLAEALTPYDVEFAAQACGVEPELFERAGLMLSEARKAATMAGDGVFDSPDALTAYASIALIDLLAGAQQVPVMPRPQFVRPEFMVTPAEAEEIYRSLENGQGKKIALITHRANPVYERGERLKEKALAGQAAAFHLAIGPLPNETSDAADLVLPEALPLESGGRVWLTSYVATPTYVEQRPVVAPPKGVLTPQEIFTGLKKYLPASEPPPAQDLRQVREWTGSETFFEIGKGIFACDAEYVPAVAYQMSLGFFEELGGLAAAPPPAGGAILLTHGGPTTGRDGAQAKWLAEIDHAGRVFVNADDARRLRVRSGDRAQVALEQICGPDETPPPPAPPVRVRVFVSEGIRPGCISLIEGQGHLDSGRLARAKRFPSGLDPDMRLLWWEDEGNGGNPTPLAEIVADHGTGGVARPLVRVRIKRF